MDGMEKDSVSGPEAPTQRIVCAAIKSKGGFVICGARHFDKVMRQQLLEQTVDWRNPDQGFIDQFGKFLTREQAWKVAVAANQIIRRVGGDEGRLYSENLY